MYREEGDKWEKKKRDNCNGIINKILSEIKIKKGKKFQTISEIQENTTWQLTMIPTKDFVECFE